MRKSRRWAVEGAIGLIYLGSFFLPIAEGYGWAYFLGALVWGIFMPLLLLYWVANPLLWCGLAAFHRGHFARAGVYGGFATALAALPMMNDPKHSLLYPHGFTEIVPWAYFVWFASMLLLALAGLAFSGHEEPSLEHPEPEKASRREGRLELD